MTTARSALNDGDILALVRGPTADARAEAAHKICRRIDTELSDDDRRAAHDVIRLMAADAADLVRRALAVTLKMSPALPRDVALILARDVDTIAAPLLNFSPVFTDADLAEIVRASGEVKQLAVARRAALSQTVTGALVQHGCEQAVRTACANDGADFADDDLIDAVERFPQSEAVATAIAYRDVLPASVSEKLVSLVSDQVRQHLVDRHQLSADTALEIALGARERATVDLVDQAGRATDLRAFVAHLHRHERLTASLLLRALAHGHMAFFEWGLAELAGVPHHRTWVMVHDAGPLGLRAIYDRAALPGELYAAFRAGVDTYHSLSKEGAELTLAQFQERMIQRYLTQDRVQPGDEIDYLLARLDMVDRSEIPMAAPRVVADREAFVLEAA